MTNLFETIFARSLFPLLKENEGVVVHHEGKGYIVWKGANFEADGDHEVRIRVVEDDDVLQYEDLSLIWMHNEPVGNA